ncbi:MAG: hypothetical protein WC777_02325 [Candidatus Gracilibacteria bacterium]|jgi:hypothetical protein
MSTSRPNDDCDGLVEEGDSVPVDGLEAGAVDRGDVEGEVEEVSYANLVNLVERFGVEKVRAALAEAGVLKEGESGVSIETSKESSPERWTKYFRFIDAAEMLGLATVVTKVGSTANPGGDVIRYTAIPGLTVSPTEAYWTAWTILGAGLPTDADNGVVGENQD